MSRDLGFSLKEIAGTLPLYRARTLTFEQMIGLLRERIDDVDRQVAALRLLRSRLSSHIGWLRRKQRASAKGASRSSLSPSIMKGRRT